MPQNRPSKHAHKLIHQTAMAMAHEMYDAMMENDTTFSDWVSQNPGLSKKALEDKFVAKTLSHFISPARAALANMLSPTSNISDDQRERIYEALVLDNTLIRGR